MPISQGLLLLHAFPLDSSMWEPQRAVLETVPGLKVVAPNFPGFGSSGILEPDASAVTMEQAAEAALGAMDRAGVERAVVCGISMGGYVALALWRLFPARVSGLILASTRAASDDEPGQKRRRNLAQRLRAEGAAFLVEFPPALLSDKAPAELWHVVRRTIAAQSAEAIARASLGMAVRRDATPELGAISVPTLVVTAAVDALIAPEQTSKMSTRIPGARLEVLDGCGHLSNLEAPARFNELLLGHLRLCARH